MKKYVKMAVYGEPGVGKSTFAYKAPKPFFITTDGNYEYLEDYFGANPENHQQVFSWKEAKAAFRKNFDNYETIVVDLLEDLYMWSENEFCKDNNIQHISDLGYGKGYGMLSNEFFIEIQKLLALPKNIILILHGNTSVLKDRRGVEYTKYAPSSLIREKLITQIEGRVRFFVRAFAETCEDGNGRLVTKRYLSLSPDGFTEYGITRGLSGDVPRFIPLDWETFYTIACREPEQTGTVTTTTIIETPDMPKMQPAPITKALPNVEATKAKLAAKKVKPAEPVKVKEPEPVAEQKKVEEVKEEIAEEVKETEDTVTTEQVPETKTELSNSDKLAAIKAKLAALKANK